MISTALLFLGEGKQPPKKKRKICYDFISSIDQTGNSC